MTSPDCKSSTQRRYRELSHRLFGMDNKALYALWHRFKTARTADEYMEVYNEEYLTVMERETMLDIIFQRLMNEKECHRTGDDTANQ